MLCSIIISNFNKSKYLDECLKSAVNQTYKNIEIIFSDNGSNDNSLEIANKFKSINTLVNKRSTNFPALNQIDVILKAFEKSSGDFIFFLDSDDFFELDKIEKIIQYNNINNFQFIADTPELYFNENKTKNFKINSIFNLMRSWPIIFPTSSLSCSRKFFNNFKNFIYQNQYEKIEIDTRLNIYSFIDNKRKIFNKKIVTNYRQTNEGIMSNYRKFDHNWWQKRLQAHNYMNAIKEIKKININKNLDYYVTKLFTKF